MRWAAIVLLTLLCSTAGDTAPARISHESASLGFTYEWPAEAAAIPLLDARFRADAERQYEKSLASALTDETLYEQQNRRGLRDLYSKEWTTAGETRRLLALQYKHVSFTGGAHPNTDFGALLWDLKMKRPVAIEALFLRKHAFGNLTRASYCKRLDGEREQRRGKDWKSGLQDFNACPDYADLAILPVDTNYNQRFDAIEFIASPYTAGPYVEGAYEISIPINAQLIAAIRPEFRQSFEAQRQ